MAQTQIIYRGWKLYSDKGSTEKTYAELEQSGAESCGCDSCKNFIKQREVLFPKEVKELLQQLGIDYRKEIEVTEFGELENGLRYYSGWFHFKGSFNGNDCTLPLPGGGYTTDLMKITENFGIGFRYGHALTPFKDKEAIVQIEFDCQIPWILSNE